MDFSRFLDENRGSWRRLEQLLDEVESSSLRRLPAEDVRELSRLYRKASSDLLLARDLGTRADVVDYLEAIVGRAYAIIYASKKLRGQRVLTWLIRGWPLALRRERTYVLLASGVFGLGILAAFILTLLDPDAFDHLVPAEMTVLYAEAPENYRDSRFGDMKDADAASFSTFLMVNNIRVALRSFVMGLTLGIGTLATLFYNGVILGALAANFTQWGQSIPFWALILPHGIVEIFSICVGGGGGLILADAILRPGRRRRMAALRERGAEALVLVGIAVPFLVFAGLVEGYVTPLAIVPDAGKLAFAALTALGLGLYIAAPWISAEDRAAARGVTG